MLRYAGLEAFTLVAVPSLCEQGQPCAKVSYFCRSLVGGQQRVVIRRHVTPLFSVEGDVADAIMILDLLLLHSTTHKQG